MRSPSTAEHATTRRCLLTSRVTADMRVSITPTRHTFCKMPASSAPYPRCRLQFQSGSMPSSPSGSAPSRQVIGNSMRLDPAAGMPRCTLPLDAVGRCKQDLQARRAITSTTLIRGSTGRWCSVKSALLMYMSVLDVRGTFGCPAGLCISHGGIKWRAHIRTRILSSTSTCQPHNE